MLTIREPITLKTNRSIQGIRQDMNEKMMANYNLMNLSIRKEELLHITSKPPEIYFAEGDLLQMKTNIQNENLQEIRLDVVNNLLNRILVANTDNFTYQDTVYISNVLRKLGIRDEKTFMKQVFELQKEQKETRQLLHKYEENQKLLQQLLVMDEGQAGEEHEKQEIIHEKESRLFLHNEIFKRLETGKVYQDIRKFSKNVRHESQEIYPLEMQIAEQARAAQNLLLQNIKSEITNSEASLSYVHYNRYEYLQEMTEEITQELEEQISAAILLNLADQSYSLRQEQIEQNSHQWYSIAGSLFQTAENTWKRYETNLMERKHVSEVLSQILEESNHVKHLENEVISHIVEEYDRSLQLWQEENRKFQEFLIQKNTIQQDNRNVSLSGGSYYLTREELELHHLATEEETKEGENVITTEQLQKQLEVFNRKNYENYRKITEIGKQVPNVKERKVNRKKAQLDALRALESREEVLREYLTEDRKDPVAEMQEHTKQQIYELLSEETKEIYRQYLQQNTNVDNAFLQQIMAQSGESEKQREIIQYLQQSEREDVYNLIKQEREQAAEDFHKDKDISEATEQLGNYLKMYHQKEREYIRENKQEKEHLLELKNKEIYYAEEIGQDVQIPEASETKPEKKSNREKESKLVQMQDHTKQQIYELLSEETKEIYRQYLQQNTNVDNAFLQQIMAQSGESEKQREIIQYLQQSEQEDVYNLIKQEREQAVQEIRENKEFMVSIEQLRKSLEMYQQRGTEFLRETKQEKERVLELKNKEVCLTGETIQDSKMSIDSETEFGKKHDSDNNRQLIEIWKTIEKQVVPFFSDKTRNVYERFLAQKEKEKTTFLQHVIEQPKESELLKEVIETLRYAEQQKTGIKTEYELLENTKYLKPVVLQNVKNEIRKQILVFRELQKEMPDPETEGIFVQKEAKEAAYLHEINLMELKENIENQILRQQMEKSVAENKSVREIINHRIDFVHKTEQTLNQEELLEEIRMQNQRTLKTQQTEEHTIRNERDVKKVLQESVNHIQMRRTEDIEELVQQSVKRQLNNLSEQVYGKLEKKLQTERKRRGYF